MNIQIKYIIIPFEFWNPERIQCELKIGVANNRGCNPWYLYKMIRTPNVVQYHTFCILNPIRGSHSCSVFSTGFTRGYLYSSPSDL